eukprot:CAMPEP_0185845014 /NCGR_PEP_ID=MMETSP1354-20130828/1084_1 /TAXON_ID=708628 /ORGANISM="Erythrolobus madagascarensis, Strain CCMP3276" /LENGTH=218 /DNA_ID=CAMNT_0028544863 /DNA_START=423 /DNA_END=1079 /DNA_ORIENTATION=-
MEQTGGSGSTRRRTLQQGDDAEDARRKVYALVSPRNESLLATESPRRAPVDANAWTPRSSSTLAAGSVIAAPSPRSRASGSQLASDSKELRREKNRESARKYRQRKRETEAEIGSRIEQLEAENQALLAELVPMYQRALVLNESARAFQVIPQTDTVPTCALVEAAIQLQNNPAQAEPAQHQHPIAGADIVPPDPTDMMFSERAVSLGPDGESHFEQR